MAVFASLCTLGRHLQLAPAARALPLRAHASRGCARSLTAADEFVAGLSYDLETTGLDTASCEVVQLAIVCVNSRKNAEFSRLIYPRGAIDEGASNVHGWTKEKLWTHGAVTFAEAWAECEGWLDDTFNATRPLVWAAHNGQRFDRRVLERMIQEETGSSSAAFSGLRARHVDTLQLARATCPGRVGPGSYTLGRLHADADEGAIEDAHDALVDARALAKVWRWLATRDVLTSEAAPAESGALRQRAFQAYLQRLGHDPAPSAAPARGASAQNALAAPKRRGPAKASKATRIGAKSDAPRPALCDESTAVIEFPGVGKKLAARLEGKGIRSVADLKLMWHEKGSSRTKVGSWLQKSMPGMPKLTVYKLAKELELAVTRDAGL